MFGDSSHSTQMNILCLFCSTPCRINGWYHDMQGHVPPLLSNFLLSRVLLFISCCPHNLIYSFIFPSVRMIDPGGSSPEPYPFLALHLQSPRTSHPPSSYASASPGSDGVAPPAHTGALSSRVVPGDPDNSMSAPDTHHHLSPRTSHLLTSSTPASPGSDGVAPHAWLEAPPSTG
jgi:hypothetical protein